METAEIKRMQRKEIKERWKSISQKEKKQWDKAIFTSFFSLQGYKCADTVFCFVSMENEPDTLNIIKRMLNDKKRVCVPRCISKGVMEACAIKSLDELESGSYGILEPSESTPKVDIGDIDISIVPCVSADRNLKRLGHGGGYYDRFMQNGRFLKVMLSYEALLLEDVAAQEHDVSCDYLITEEKIYKR